MSRAYVETHEMARELGVTRTTVLRVLRRENIPITRFGRAIRVERAAWEKFLASITVSSAPTHNGGKPVTRPARPSVPAASQKNLFHSETEKGEVRVLLEIEISIRPLIVKP